MIPFPTLHSSRAATRCVLRPNCTSYLLYELLTIPVTYYTSYLLYQLLTIRVTYYIRATYYTSYLLYELLTVRDTYCTSYYNINAASDWFLCVRHFSLEYEKNRVFLNGFYIVTGYCVAKTTVWFVLFPRLSSRETKIWSAWMEHSVRI